MKDHNSLARDFVMTVIRETRTYSELMVVAESMNLAIMMVLNSQYGFSRPNSVEMLELMIQQATDRFTQSKHL